MAKVKTIKLPELLSDCVLLALRDLNAVEKMKKYSIDMEEWHSPKADGTCTVCFAGSVISRTLKTPINVMIFDECTDFDSYTSSRLDAIDAVRLGLIDQAFAAMGRKLPFGVEEEIDVFLYEDNPVGFKEDMKNIAGLLKRLGL